MRFTPLSRPSRMQNKIILFGLKDDTTESIQGEKSLPLVADMKLKEIQSELKNRGIAFADCFDRDSLTARLNEARESSELFPTPDDIIETEEEEKEIKTPSTNSEEIISQSDKTNSSSEPKPVENETSSNNSPSKFDRESTLESIRSLRVSELRTQLGSRNIRWAGMLEKEELVVALTNAMEESANFSPSGVISPGKVAELTDNELSQELEQISDSALPPLLLDVYATWCGPCKMMAPELEKAAKELGSTVRVAKLDSDKNTLWASKLKVQGLPTVILFDGSTGKELDRVEGALPFDSLITFAKKHIL